MNKFGSASIPENEDSISILLNSGEKFGAKVVNWGIEKWGQSWATVKTAEGLLQVNLSQVAAYMIKKAAPTQYQVVEKVTDDNGKAIHDDNGERVKVTRPIKLSMADPKYQVVRRGIATKTITRSIPDGEKVVKEPEVSLKKSLAGLNVMEQSKELVDLYHEKRRLEAESIKDVLTSKELKEPTNNYAMPSFKKHSSSET